MPYDPSLCSLVLILSSASPVLFSPLSTVFSTRFVSQTHLFSRQLSAFYALSIQLILAHTLPLSLAATSFLSSVYSPSLSLF